VPVGGTTGQVLTKLSAADYNTNWQAPAGGITLPLSQTLTFAPDATYDIGATAASRPRDLFLGRNATVPGALAIGPAGVTAPTLHIAPGAANYLTIESPTSAILAVGKVGVNLASNAYFDGTNWMRYDTAAATSLIVVGAGSMTFQTAGAAANPVSFAARLAIDSTGITVTGSIKFPGGGIISDYGSSYVAINNLTVTPGPLAAATINCNGPLNNAAISAYCTIAEGVIWNGWARVAGANVGIINTSYGTGIYWADAIGPRIYGGSYAPTELLQSHARHDATHRMETGGNVTINYTTSDGGCFNTGTYVYLPDLNYVWGRVFWVKNMTGAAFNVYVSNGNGIYTTGWVNPMTLQHGESITVVASQTYSGYCVI
jgi:hypothetical protein